MAGPIAIDTPDYQRGIFNPQVLLARVAANTANVTVTVPPNAETLVVVSAGTLLQSLVGVVGQTTGIDYPGVIIPTQGHLLEGTTWLFDVAASVDPQVEVGLSPAPATSWFVYADAGVHTVVDLSLKKNSVGQGYVIPSVPSTLKSDHPPDELQVTGVGVTTTGSVLAAPGAGERYRVFALQLTPVSGTLFGFLEDNDTGQVLLAGGASWPAQLQIPLTGLPLSTNGPLGFTSLGGAGEMIAVVYYTTETV